jgi:F-type H+-transporting ATPase subunit gamma
MKGRAGAPALLAGSGKEQTHLIVAITSDKGLCGAFNSSIARRARQLARRLRDEGKAVKFLCVGRRGRDNLRRDSAAAIVDTIMDVGRKQLRFSEADAIADKIAALFAKGDVDVVTVVYNKFKSAMSQIPTDLQLIPFAPGEEPHDAAAGDGARATYEYEPDESEILRELLPRNLSVQIFTALLESNASEAGARMTAMDNATRNAGEMIRKLTLTYNRTRQAMITKELIEIISGAEAL